MDLHWDAAATRRLRRHRGKVLSVSLQIQRDAPCRGSPPAQRRAAYLPWKRAKRNNKTLTGVEVTGNGPPRNAFALFFPPPSLCPRHPTLAPAGACAHGCRCFSVWVSAHTGSAPTGAETLQRFDLGQREKGSAAARALAPPRCKLENTAASIGAGGATREEKRAGGSICIWRNHIIALLKVDFYFHFETFTLRPTDAAV